MIELNKDKITRNMQDLIRCKTVSNRDENLVDRNEFNKLYDLIEARYPVLYSVSKPLRLGKTGFLFHINGSGKDNNSVCKCAVLMAHYDVVPVVEEEWSKPPFDAVIEDGVLWGRGALDTKGTFCSILEAVNAELEEGWLPQNDLYLSFSGEEEIDGTSCTEIVSWFKQNGIRPDFVLDEGGAIVENVFPGVTKKCAMIGTSEKGSVNIDCIAKTAGGHASAPPLHSAAGCVALAVNEIENIKYKTQITTPVKEMLSVLAPGKKILFTLAFKLFGRKLGGEINALLHTTCAVTRMQGSKAYNVLPHEASFGMNLRVLEKDTIDSVVERMKKAVKKVSKKTKAEFSFNVVNGMNASITSNTNCGQWDNLKKVINKTWSDILVSPYLMMACSDSRHYCKITDNVYRFSAMFMSKEDRGLIHGNDERIKLDILFETVAFYCNLLETL